MAQLTVKNIHGDLLFDTGNITYGLVKSGYLTFVEAWRRRSFKGGNVDPSWGGNWTESTASQSINQSDAIYGFTIVGSISPIVFITGSGCLQGTKVSGDSVTFLYGNVDSGTKYYCFDLMRDVIAGSPFLKTCKEEDGVMTFNSLQPALNVVKAVQAPPPTGTQGAAYPPFFGSRPYAGGVITTEQIQHRDGPPWVVNRLTCRVTIPLEANVEYAAYLPWSRGCQIWIMSTRYELYPTYRYGGSEGCAGREGGVQFMFGPAGGSPEDHPMYVSGTPMPPNFSQVATDRLPTALVITTLNLPFPFN